MEERSAGESQIDCLLYFCVRIEQGRTTHGENGRTAATEYRVVEHCLHWTVRFFFREKKEKARGD